MFLKTRVLGRRAKPQPFWLRSAARFVLVTPICSLGIFAQANMALINAVSLVQGDLAHKKQHPPLGPPYGPRNIPTVESYRGAVSHERGTPVWP